MDKDWIEGAVKLESAMLPTTEEPGVASWVISVALGGIKISKE
jgi:hypothetical protein